MSDDTPSELDRRSMLKKAAAAESRPAVLPAAPSAGCWKSQPSSRLRAARAAAPPGSTPSSAGTSFGASPLRLSNCIRCTSATDTLVPPAVAASSRSAIRRLRYP